MCVVCAHIYLKFKVLKIEYTSIIFTHFLQKFAAIKKSKQLNRQKLYTKLWVKL